MKDKQLATGIEKAVIEKAWVRWMLTIFAAPLLWILLFYWIRREQIALGFLVIMLAYVVTLIIGVSAHTLEKREFSRRSEITRTLVALLSPLFWGGVLVTPYVFLYMFIFDRENFFPR